MNMKRMRGRNHRGGGGGPIRHQSGNVPLNRNHVFDSNGPDVRVRGTAQQLFEKYRPNELAGVETRYLYASRRALNLATIAKMDERAINFLSQTFGLNRVGAFLQRALTFDPAKMLGSG